MASSNFIDYVKIYFTSGNGGSGSPHLLRERNNAKGGPDGGDGGRGGHIILRGNTQHWTLLPLKYRKHIKAQHGHPGGQNQRTGADGRDEIIDVPLGTIARNAETGEQMCEVTSDGETVILLPGGKGGLGNVHFKRATHQTPRYSQPGIPGQEATIILELKILADVGLVGFPNAGKSTLLSVVSAAKPEIADYAFTTLVPNLGMVAYRNERSFVMADIPGIIEGASEGRGLGTRFLRHIERNAILLFLVPADAEDINAEYAILKNELEKYNPELMDKERIVAISKSDMLDAELKQEIAKTITFKEPWLYISSVSGDGIEALKDLIWNALQKVNE